ncbi:GlxA family transcriptional regulator [Limibaculum sp. M0105]|uniref:GlxA family transcriptional regulator n=1 Tax=Thermohalobaculum xanthum TaxID=2753746 RepID=A0A8J7M7B5_9RHOB|nr:GlxA family transcriptional regulator [Thermohalobaculum xanthum]MBK0399689.1 GlxA family transcriptional regulator [Thermohalobaculum xanthum]
MGSVAAPQTPKPEATKPREFVFLLCPMFSMIAFASAIEPLRVANRMARKPLYAWRLVSETGDPVECSNGTTVMVDGPIEDVNRDSSLVVCTGFGLDRAASKPVLTWLRKQARRGARVGALCTGAHVLAKAGLLDGKRCTIHWENHAAFGEDFPEAKLSKLLYVVDDGVFTCAGGTSSADMMLHLIADEHGADLGSLVADCLIHTPMRSDNDEQRLSVPARIGVRHPKLVQVIQMMERSTEDPVSPSDLAEAVNMSTRQLERLFRRYLNRSPKRYYMELRLDKARSLLLQTDMSVINVALACGFTSPSHFSKCYRAHFDRTPYRERGAPANTGSSKMRGPDPGTGTVKVGGGPRAAAGR